MKANLFSRGLSRRLFASILAVCMVFTMTPPVTAAGVTESGKILLSGFAELPENIREQSVPLGVSLGELNLPDTMTAIVDAASVDAEPTPDTISLQPFSQVATRWRMALPCLKSPLWWGKPSNQHWTR